MILRDDFSASVPTFEVFGECVGRPPGPKRSGFVEQCIFLLPTMLVISVINGRSAGDTSHYAGGKHSDISLLI